MNINFAKHTLTTLVLTFSIQISNAQKTKPDTTLNYFTIDSRSIGEKCKSFIYLPKDYYLTNEKYPVIYVLDAEYNFTLTCEAVKILCQSERIPPCILVGITSNNRERDLTTTEDKTWQRPPEMKNSGGADNFSNYLEKELIPVIEKKYRTQPYKVIIGHSLGGLFVMYSFSTKPTLFQAHIAIESSLWWNGGAVGKSMMNYLESHPKYQGNLFIGRIKIPREAWFPINTTIVDYLEKKRPQGLKYKYLEIENETHSTMVFPATYFGIRDIFSNYLFELNGNTEANSILMYYDSLNIKYGYSVTIPELVYNFLYEISMQRKNYKDAVKYGEMWTKFYALSYKSFLNLGIAYDEIGNKVMAVASLEKALELNPNDNTIKEKLIEVKKK